MKAVVCTYDGEVHGYVQQCNAARGSDQEAFDAIHHGIGSQCVFDQVRQRVGNRGLGFVGATFHRGPTILLGVLIEKTCVCVDSSLRMGGADRFHAKKQRRKGGSVFCLAVSRRRTRIRFPMSHAKAQRGKRWVRR